MLAFLALSLAFLNFACQFLAGVWYVDYIKENWDDGPGGNLISFGLQQWQT